MRHFMVLSALGVVLSLASCNRQDHRTQERSSDALPTTLVADRPQSDDPQEDHPRLEVKPDATEGLGADEIFARRILPIAQSKKASSCTECHFSGVELRDYLHEDQASTFAALRDGGLIDMKAPDDSKLLTFIARRPKDENELLAKVRRNEYQAMRAWIRAAVKDKKLLATKPTGATIGPKLSVEVIRHARKDRVLTSFIDNVWSQIGRCINCHTPGRNQRQVAKWGEQVSWIVAGDPAGTLHKLVDGGNIDVEDPEKSLVLLKPAGEAEHAGGPKFFPGGHTYKQFLTFLEDYAAVNKGDYKKPDDLPRPSSELVRLGRQHLRITGVPEDLKGTPLRVDIYRWLGDRGDWSVQRWGTAYNPIPPRRAIWQSTVSVIAPRGSRRAKTIAREPLLPHGKYLIKIYRYGAKLTRDEGGLLQIKPSGGLKETTLIGEVEIDGAWKPGYQPPKVVRFPSS